MENSPALIGVESNFVSWPVCYRDQNKYSAARSKIIHGRDINARDISLMRPVAVIERSVAMFLFHKEDAVGEVIYYQGMAGPGELEVVGVIEDLPSTRDLAFAFTRQLRRESKAKIVNDLQVYVPYSFGLDSFGEDLVLQIFLYEVPGEQTDSLDLLFARLLAQPRIAGQRSLVRGMVSQRTLFQEAEQVKAESKMALTVFLLVLTLLSGFVIMTVLLFSIKERVYEIGIRRAVGASSFDIIIQFVLEGLILSFTAALISCFLSIHVCTSISALFIRAAANVSLKVGPATIYATFCIALLQGVLYSLVPAIAASRTSPTDAIRWD